MLITHFDPERAEARRREALNRRFVTVDPDEAGTARVTGQVDGLGGIALHNTLNDLAEVIARGGHEGHHDELRALALETLADPTRAAHLLNGTLLSTSRP